MFQIPEQYILVDGLPVVEPDWVKWGAWFESADRQIAESIVGGDEGSGVRISTSFIGLPAAATRPGPPLLFESMVFGGPRDKDCRRYATQSEALAGHDELVASCLIPQGDDEG